MSGLTVIQIIWLQTLRQNLTLFVIEDSTTRWILQVAKKGTNEKIATFQVTRSMLVATRLVGDCPYV